MRCETVVLTTAELKLLTTCLSYAIDSQDGGQAVFEESDMPQVRALLERLEELA